MIMAMQNTTHAVMAQRHEPGDSLDDFPTPPWATRALIEHVIGTEKTAGRHCLEPACGRGYMAVPLGEYFGQVTATDVALYGFAPPKNFLDYAEGEDFDWIITNPPFRLAEEFVIHALPRARQGVAMLVRTVFIESVGRLERLFAVHPPTCVAQFAERVPMVKGRLDQKASTATGYAWVVWEKPLSAATQLRWIPRCRKELERPSDYLPEFLANRVSLQSTQVNPTPGNKQFDLFGGDQDERNTGTREAANRAHA